MTHPGTGDELICGRQPVLAALRSGRPVRRLAVARGSRGPVVDEIFELARAGSVPYDLRPREDLDRLAGGEARHQGVIAFAAARQYATYADLLAQAGDRAFLVFLDGIQDPHNLGAIIRSAHALGADGVVVPERGSAGLTAAAARAAAGAAEFVPICQVGNLVRALAQARAAGLWLTALVPGAARSFTEVDYRGAVGLVVGGEGRGVRRLVQEACDHAVGIPMARAEVGSFNASVAAALALYEVYRQRREPFTGNRGDG
ncbi:MAG: 23S rRNA (guanosine(2251)-2'-O)-methyltransferase RlmB [Gemmatimonadota bacterium]